MDKEKIITVAIGLVTGIVFAGIYFGFTKYLPSFTKPKNPAVVYEPTDTKPTPISDASFSLDNPTDFSTTTDSTATISGSAQPGSSVLVLTNLEEKTASADATGKFVASVKLENGQNVIGVSNFTQLISRNVILEISQ
jgi:hypothetical protein